MEAGKECTLLKCEGERATSRVSINTSLAILAVSFFKPVGYFSPGRGRPVEKVLRQGGNQGNCRESGGGAPRSGENLTLQGKHK